MERRERKDELRNERASTTDQTGKRHRFPFPAMPACIRLAVVGGVFASLPLPVLVLVFDAGLVMMLMTPPPRRLD